MIVMLIYTEHGQRWVFVKFSYYGPNDNSATRRIQMPGGNPSALACRATRSLSALVNLTVNAYALRSFLGTLGRPPFFPAIACLRRPTAGQGPTYSTSI